jgi:2-(1,2-epoxy-1,2-dihydrophenyl)acetyl-CoA isomerase
MIEPAYAGFTTELNDDGVLLVTLNRPERMNGLRRAVKRDLAELATQIAYQRDVRAVLLTGGPNFCAGDDVTPGAQDDWEGAVSQRIDPSHHDHFATYASLRAISQNAIRAWKGLDALTVAAIDGYAIQSGLSLALACDFRIATPRAKLGSATLRMGYLPDEGGHHLLVQYLGVPAAKDFVFRKRMVDGAEALRLGLVNELAEPDELMPRALAFAGELAEGPQVAMRLLKHAIDAAPNLTFEQACMDIAARTAVSDHHPDAKEGVSAFAAKPRRKPKFNQG